MKQRKCKDSTGEVHGRLTVISQYFKVTGTKAKRKKYFTVECSCGTVKDVRADGVLGGQVVSCGCYHSEVSKEVHARHLRPTMFTSEPRTHGMTGSSEYKIWNQMKQRCGNSKNINYHHYGARGIEVCERWQNSFEAFYEDMGPRPSRRHTIDRIDNSLGYSPENCKWATRKEQANNTRSNVSVLCGGAIMTIAQAADTLGLDYNTLYNKMMSQSKKGIYTWGVVKWKEELFTR